MVSGCFMLSLFSVQEVEHNGGWSGGKHEVGPGPSASFDSEQQHSKESVVA